VHAAKGRARREGFTSSWALARDRAFDSLRERDEFQRELAHAQRVERDARCALEGTGLRLVAV